MVRLDARPLELNRVGQLFFNQPSSIWSRPICSYNSATNASWPWTSRRRSSENNSAAPSSNRRFHWPICVECTPNCDTNWLVVRSPRIAAKATFAFTPASIRRRFAPMQSSQVWTNPTTIST